MTDPSNPLFYYFVFDLLSDGSSEIDASTPTGQVALVILAIELLAVLIFSIWMIFSIIKPH